MTRIEVPGRDIVGIRAANPSPFTLEGTNSWIVGREPAWLIDPGPALEEHVEALAAELSERGGLGGIALTHDHVDHAEAVPALLARFPGTPVAAARGDVEVRMSDGSRFGPLEAVSTPGHAPDHLAFLARDPVAQRGDPMSQESGAAAFTGDAVLGEGSVFISPYPGSLAAYLDGLERLRRRRPVLILPGHGPPVSAVEEKLDECVSHRLERERRLLAALESGRRTVDELLDEAWDDAPASLRPAAAWTLAAHLDKLAAEGKLPEGVERPHLAAP